MGSNKIFVEQANVDLITCDSGHVCILREQIWLPHMEPVPSWLILIKQKQAYITLYKSENKGMHILISIYCAYTQCMHYGPLSIFTSLAHISQLFTIDTKWKSVANNCVNMHSEKDNSSDTQYFWNDSSGHLDYGGVFTAKPNGHSGLQNDLWADRLLESVKGLAWPCCTI